ncbi:hypothetical protein [Peribacillus tepidiphilus]|uniref:hypothetical protein n=1 Tax=Peribacillus tepidiphilus TaxID=2652445 RepID=UPI0012909FF0|nr:hypothetical protein [Peribacillus tepidiphilus]
MESKSPHLSENSFDLSEKTDDLSENSFDLSETSHDVNYPPPTLRLEVGASKVVAPNGTKFT